MVGFWGSYAHSPSPPSVSPTHTASLSRQRTEFPAVAALSRKFYQVTGDG